VRFTGLNLSAIAQASLGFTGGSSKLRIGDTAVALAADFDAAVEVNVSAASAELFPGGAVQVEVTDDNPADAVAALAGTLNLATGLFLLNGRRLRATFSDLLVLQAQPSGLQPAFSFTYDPSAPGSSELLRFASLTGSIPALAINGQEPTLAAIDLAVTKAGTWSVGSVTASLPSGYPDFFDLGGLVPIQVQSVRVHFPNPADLSALSLDATLKVRLDAFNYSFLPTLLVSDGAGGLRPIGTTETFDLSVNLAALREGNWLFGGFSPFGLAISVWWWGIPPLPASFASAALIPRVDCSRCPAVPPRWKVPLPSPPPPIPICKAGC